MNTHPRNEVDKMLARLKTPEGKAELAKTCAEISRKEQESEQRMLSKHFPDHITHTQEILDMKHFDAMFIEKTVLCSCGSKFIVDCDMYE